MTNLLTQHFGASLDDMPAAGLQPDQIFVYTDSLRDRMPSEPRAAALYQDAIDLMAAWVALARTPLPPLAEPAERPSVEQRREAARLQAAYDQALAARSASEEQLRQRWQTWLKQTSALYGGEALATQAKITHFTGQGFPHGYTLGEVSVEQEDAARQANALIRDVLPWMEPSRVYAELGRMRREIATTGLNTYYRNVFLAVLAREEDLGAKTATAARAAGVSAQAVEEARGRYLLDQARSAWETWAQEQDVRLTNVANGFTGSYDAWEDRARVEALPAEARVAFLLAHPLREMQIAGSRLQEGLSLLETREDLGEDMTAERAHLLAQIPGFVHFHLPSESLTYDESW